MIERLLREPQQFGFFQAVRLLDRWLAPASVDGQGLSRLNFRNSLSLTFPASEIESLRAHPRQHEGDEGMGGGRQLSAWGVGPGSVPVPMGAVAATDGWRHAQADIDRVDMTPAFMGLLGVSGSMPLLYTEILAHREHDLKDPAGRAFMDIFSHRVVSVFYQAWRKHRLPIGFEADRDRHFLPLVLSLAGLGQKGLRDRLGAREGAVADEALAYYAGALQQRALSARQLQQLLQGYFGVPVRVEQFVGRWYRLPEDGRFHLGRPGGMAAGMAGGAGLGQGVLGHSAMLGERVWQRDLRVRVALGPLDARLFRRFLPGGPGARALKELLTMLSGVSLEYEINLCLERHEAQGATLDSSRASNAIRLGWDTFLLSRPADEDRIDVRYDIHAAA